MEFASSGNSITAVPIGVLEIDQGSNATLHFSGRSLRAVIGRGGTCREKLEGDGCTPTGILRLRKILYRADRLSEPIASVSCESLKETDGWCDDVKHTSYNKQIQLPFEAGHERLWLESSLYDIIGVLDYNCDPILVGRGSAIFLHIARPEMTPTDGCIALSKEDLLWVLREGLLGIEIP